MIFACIEDFFRALGPEEGYFPPSTLPTEDHALKFAIRVIFYVLFYCCAFTSIDQYSQTQLLIFVLLRGVFT